jgi:hypothetical protein
VLGDGTRPRRMERSSRRTRCAGRDPALVGAVQEPAARTLQRAGLAVPSRSRDRITRGRGVARTRPLGCCLQTPSTATATC